MNKNIQENPIKQAKPKRICTRAEQIEHSPERAKLFARNTKKKRTTLTEIYELDNIYSNRKDPKYSITVLDTTRTITAKPLDDIYINNIPDRYAFKEIETGNPRKVVRKFATFTIVSEKIGGYTPPRRAAPPQKEVQELYLHHETLC